VSTAHFEKVMSVLDEMRAAGVIAKYAIGGAFAATLHDEPISTIDLDIFFLYNEKPDSILLSLEGIYDFARRYGFSFDHEFINIHGWLVKFVEASHNDLWRESVEQADTMKIGEFDVPVIGCEHLVAMWLFAGRPKDYQKIALFWEAGILNRTHLAEVLERFELSEKWKNEKWRITDEQ
jgi:hypothetical protein